MPTETPALELGADANVKPATAKPIRINFFMLFNLPKLHQFNTDVDSKVAQFIHKLAPRSYFG
jgi:hypothetical protein